MNVVRTLVEKNKAGYPALYLLTAEDARATSLIEEAAKLVKRQMFVWTYRGGLLTKGKGSKIEKVKDSEDPDQVLKAAHNLDQDSIVVLRHYHHFLDNAAIQAMLLELVPIFKASRRQLIVLTPVLKLPPELEKEFSLIEMPLPTREELLGIADSFTTNVGKPNDEVRRALAENARGLTYTEAENAIALAAIRPNLDKGKTDSLIWEPEVVKDEKCETVKKSGFLSYYPEAGIGLTELGGMDLLKAWLVKRAKVFKEPDKAAAFKLPIPKGLLMLGPPGTGKSLGARVTANTFKLPLIRVDMGAIFGGIVGQSEGNARAVIRFLEAVSPCVTGETEVTLADGSRQAIKELWEDAQDDLRVVCWDEKKLKMGTTKVRGITRRTAEAFHIEAASGFYLNATADHRHYVMRGGMPEWARTDELRPGDMLSVLTTHPHGSFDLTSCQPDGTRLYTKEDGTTEIRKGGGGWRDARVPTLPVQWSPGLAWLLGVIEGDGYLGKSGAIGLTNTSEILLDRFENELKELFGIRADRQDRSDRQAVLPEMSATPAFKPCWDSKASNKLTNEFLVCARELILTAPYPIRAAFLAGWIDTDGCVGESKLALTVKGPKKRDERRSLARALIQSLGVVPPKFDTETMEITGPRAEKLASIISDWLVLKNQKAIDLHVSCKGFTREMGFSCGFLLKEAREAAGVSHADIGISTSLTWACENGRSIINERHLQTYIEKFGEAASQLLAIRDAECRWVEVRQITRMGPQEVFDLMCEGEDTHSFIANGLVTHNCVGWLDEIEKGFAGSSGGMLDSGVGARVLSTFLTWMQEKTSQVFIYATANNVAALPPELLRKGRFDEMFFVNLPSMREREEIFRIQIRRLNREHFIGNKVDVKQLAQRTEGYSGAEIEAVVRDALYDAFEVDKDLNMLDLEEAMSAIVPLSCLMKDDIDRLQKWAKGRTRPANLGEIIQGNAPRVVES